MESEIEMQDNYKVCRLCQNPNSDEELISPCGCDGINQWVHRSCLNSYRIFYNDPVYFLKCPVCKVDYTFKHIQQPIKWLITKMVFKLIFQVLMLFAELIALFYLIGIIPYALDANGFHIFIKEGTADPAHLFPKVKNCFITIRFPKQLQRAMGLSAITGNHT